MTCTLRLLVAVFVALVMSWSSSGQDLSPDVVKAADFAIDAHNHKSNCAYAYKVVAILSQTTELYPPTRVKYSIEARVAETNCRNNGKENLEECSLMGNGQTMICNFVVLVVPGENTEPNQLLSDHCA